MGKPDLKIFFILLAIGSLIFITLRVLGFDGLYGQDAYVYAGQTKALKHWIINGGDLPFFHWPSGYPLFCLIFYSILGDLALSMQITSLIFWCLTVFMSYKLLALILNLKHDFWLFLMSLSMIGFAPYFLRLGVSAMSDMSCAFFCVTTIYFIFQYKKQARLNTLLIAAICFSLAVFTRYAAFILLLPPALFILGTTLSKKDYKSLFVGSLIVLSGLVSIFIIKDIGEFINALEHTANLWNPINLFKKSFSAKGFSQDFRWINAIYILQVFYHPGFFFFALPLWFFAFRKQNQSLRLLLFTIIFYLIFIGGLNTQNNRFFVIIMPIVFVCLAYYWQEIKTLNSPPYKKVVALSIIGVINILLTFYSSQRIYKQQQTDLILSEKITSHEIQTLFTFEVDQALTFRGFKGKVINLWYPEANNLQIKPGDYVLLNVSKWEKPWENHQLMKNVELLMSTNKLIFIETLTEGWTLYKYG